MPTARGYTIFESTANGTNVSVSLDEILASLKQIKDSIEKDKRANYEAFTMVKFVLPVVYVALHVILERMKETFPPIVQMTLFSLPFFTGMLPHLHLLVFNACFSILAKICLIIFSKISCLRKIAWLSMWLKLKFSKLTLTFESLNSMLFIGSPFIKLSFVSTTILK